MQSTVAIQSGDLNLADSVLSSLEGYFYRCEAGGGYDVIDVTEGIERLLGYSRAQVLSGAVRTLSAVHPDDMARIDAQTMTAVSSGKSWENYFRMIRADGSIVHVLELGNAVRDPLGQPIYFEGAIISAEGMRTQRDAAAEIDQSLAAIIAEADRITRILGTLRVLALNTRIEAARFGISGASFSAVSDEMRALAARRCSGCQHHQPQDGAVGPAQIRVIRRKAHHAR